MSWNHEDTVELVSSCLGLLLTIFLVLLVVSL